MPVPADRGATRAPLVPEGGPAGRPAARDASRSSTPRVPWSLGQALPGAPLRRPELLALQRKAGNRLVRRLLGPQLSTGAPRVQRHAGHQSAKSLLEATRSGGSKNFAHLLADGPALPEVFQQVQAAIGAEQTPVYDIVMNALRPRMQLRQSLSFDGGVRPAVGADPARTLRNVASGEGQYAFDIDLPGLHDFVAALFDLIEDRHAGTSLNILDLFHSHVVPVEDPRDLVAVFHAKEWPTEELGARAQMYTNAGLIDRNTPRFSKNDRAVDERNFLWTLSSNRIYLLSDPDRTNGRADPEFAALISPSGDPQQATGDTRQIGSVTETTFGTDVMNANYFPGQLSGSPGEQLFFTPVGQWGVLMMLEQTYPHIPPEEIKSTYQRLDDSLVATRRELDARSQHAAPAPAQGQPAPAQGQGAPASGGPTGAQGGPAQPAQASGAAGRLVAMGFDAGIVNLALGQVHGDFDQALELLISWS